jgi:hypothetical protein
VSPLPISSSVLSPFWALSFSIELWRLCHAFCRTHYNLLRCRLSAPVRFQSYLCPKNSSTAPLFNLSLPIDVRLISCHPCCARSLPTTIVYHVAVVPSWGDGCRCRCCTLDTADLGEVKPMSWAQIPSIQPEGKRLATQQGLTSGSCTSGTRGTRGVRGIPRRSFSGEAQRCIKRVQMRRQRKLGQRMTIRGGRTTSCKQL